MKLKTRESVVAYSFILPGLLGFAMFFLIPFVGSLYYCFTQGIGGKAFVGLKNFKDLLQSSSFLLASKNTLIFNLISVPFIIAVSFLLAMLLNKERKGSSTFRTFFVMPLVVPVASVILVWQILFNEYGALNHFLSNFGIMPVDWMRTGWSVGVLVLVYIWKNCGYNVILFLAGLNSIPREYFESARIDGAGPFACLRKITIPFLIPTGFFVFIISVINSFKVFREAYLLAGSYPYPAIYQLQHFMNNNFFNLSYQRLTTAAFLMMIVICALVLFLYRMERRLGRNFG
jgi:multiple sugar transport system permease protein